MSKVMSNISRGTIIDDRFRIIELIGSGGFGSVYRAEDPVVRRDVAIKMLQFECDPTSDARFLREAKALSLIEHSNVVKIFKYGRDSARRNYIAMQYLAGDSLQDVLSSKGKLEWRHAAQLLVQVASGVACAHAAGVVHRDLKPSNLIVRPSEDKEGCEHLTVVDFGLATLLQQGTLVQRLTQSGMVMGTTSYLSPELCLGEPATAQSDIYSLGCILYECVSGSRPFIADDVMNVLYGHVNTPAARLSNDLGVPETFERIIFKALEKNPLNRFASMQEFEQALNAVAQRDGVIDASLTNVHLPSASSFQVGRRGVKRALIGATAGTAIALLILLPYGLEHSNPGTGTSWEHVHENARVAEQRRDYDEAWHSRIESLRLAANNEQKWRSRLGLGATILIHGLRQDQTALALQVMREAQSESPQKQAAIETLIGLNAAEESNWNLARHSLESRPWLKLQPNDDLLQMVRIKKIEYACNVKLGLAEVYSEHPDYGVAIECVSRIAPFKPTDEPYHLRGLVALGVAKVLNPKSTSTERADGVALLKDILRNCQDTSVLDLELIKGTLGESEYSKTLADRKLADQKAMSR